FAQCGDVFFTNTHQGLTATYTPNIPANCIPISFNWDFGDGTSDTSQLPIHTYNTAGNYYVCLNLSMYDSNMVATNCTFCDTVMVGQNLCDSVKFVYADCAGVNDNIYIFYSWVPSGINNPTYNWTFGNFFSSTAKNPIVEFPHGGTMYNVCLTVSGFDNQQQPITCTYCDSAFIPPYICDSLSFYTLSNGLLVFFAPSYGMGFPLPHWTRSSNHFDCGDGAFISPNRGKENYGPVLHTYSQPGTYVVSMIYSDLLYNDALSCEKLDTITVDNNNFVNFCDSVDYRSFTVIGLPTSVFFELKVPQSYYVFNHYWVYGNDTIKTIDNPSLPQINFGKEGVFNVCMTAYGLETQQNKPFICTKCKDVYVFPSNNEICTKVSITKTTDGLTANFTSSIPWNLQNPTYLWDFGDGTTSTQANPSHTYSQNGTYPITLTVNGYGGGQLPITCTDYDYVFIDNTNQLLCDSINFTNNIFGLKADFLSHLPVGISNPTYFWDFGDGNTSTLENPTNYYNHSGTYKVCLTVSGKNDKQQPITCTFCDSISVQIFIQNLCDSMKFTTTTDELTANFTPHLPNEFYLLNYKWDFGDGNTSTLENPSHAYSQSGMYKVCMTVNGYDFQFQFITCSYCDYIITKTTPISPSDDNSKLKVYPNPTRGDVKLELPEKEMSKLNLYDVTGKLILSHEINTNSKTYYFSIDHLSKGSYYIVVESSDG
ncbi:MAG: PKD domain-containing protein, partial [Bacteroidia bacterium]|nr:PKD domain-containing protein [Bacteroidia bacterium]